MNNLYKKYILLFLVAVLTFAGLGVSAQNAEAVQIKGKIVDEQGEALIGATVIVKGTMVGVASGTDGTFTIRATPQQTLSFTYLGYEDIEVLVGRNRNLSVVMRPDEENELEEVVVVGYGTMQKSDLSGSVASVSKEVFEDGSQMNLAEALQGQVAGVEVTSSSGALGGAVTIVIRGSNSLGSAEPLYIIDGVPFDNSYINGFEDDGSQQSPLASINPNDIASMEILKDASATAIYGSEASNGVILITTKSGQAGKPRANLALGYSYGQVMSKVDMVNYNEYVTLRQEAYVNEGSSNMTDQKLAVARQGMYKSYDWQDIMLQGGNSYNATASLSGGSDQLKYMLSVNYYDATGIVPTTAFNRLTGRLNLTFQVNDKLKVGANISMSQMVNNGQAAASGWGSSGIMSSALNVIPNVSPETSLNDLEEFDEELSYTEYVGSSSTPWLTLIGTVKENVTFSASANLYVDYQIRKGLNFKVMGNYSLSSTFAGYYRTVESSSTAYDARGIAQMKKSQNENQNNEYTLTWNETFKKDHKINMVGGFSLKQSDSESVSLQVENFPHDDFLWYNLSAGSEQEDITNSFSQSRTMSWFGRANYTLKNKYTFTFTGRIDGNSRFADGNKFSSYPAGAFMWRISQEPWLKGHRTISDLKFRISLGKTGNQAITAGQALDVVNTENVTFGNSSGEDATYVGYTQATTMKNTALTWETTTQASTGVDLSMFKNRLKVGLEAYYKYTDNLLVSANLSQHTGYLSSYLNYGSMYNIGVELSASYAIVQTKDLRVILGANIARNRATLNEVQGGLLNTGYWVSWMMRYTTPLKNGYDLGTFSGYVRDGVRQQGEAEVNYKWGTTTTDVGDVKYVDTNGDGILNDDDIQIIGSAQAAFNYGVNLTVNYKGFSLRIYGTGAYDKDIYNIGHVSYLRFSFNSSPSTQYKTVLQRWTPDNPSEVYPQLRNSNTRAAIMNRIFMEDATYFKIKTINFGYNLPDKVASVLGLGSIRVNASVTNPVTITQYTGFNPDASIGGNNSTKIGHDHVTTPSMISFTAGLDIQF